MSSITLQIKGRDWTFILMTDKRFDRLHNPDNDLNTAMTNANTYEVHFKKSEWSLIDIRHELGHVLKHMTHTQTVSMDADDMEELMCEIYASNFPDISLWADRIAEKFFGRK